MSIIKRTKANYGAVPRNAMDGKHMSLKAKGLLAYLLCMPDDWEIYVSELAKHHKEHKDTIAKTINELIDVGYVVREQIREAGKFGGYNYTVFDFRVSEKTVNEKTVSEKSVYGKSNTNKLDITKKDNTDKEIKTPLPFSSSSFIEMWEDWKAHRKEKKSPLTATSIKMQLKKFKTIGEERAIAMMAHTIEKGWTGLREEEKSFKTNNKIAQEKGKGYARFSKMVMPDYE